MHLYELVNPSDKIHFKAESDKIATLSALLLSPGYGVRGCGGHEYSGPLFLFGGGKEWVEENFAMDLDAWLGEEANGRAVSDALGSFLCCGEPEYELLESKFAAIRDEEARLKAIEDLNESRRSSVNPICLRALTVSRNIRDYLNRKKEKGDA